MSLRDLSLSDWARMSDAIARRECEMLARSHGLEFCALTTHEYCGRTHRVADFGCREAGDLVHFVLVPGGEVTLGFDSGDFRPSSRQLKSFAESARHFDLGPSITKFLDSQMWPRRTVAVAPTLLEFEARAVEPRDDEPLARGDPMFDKFVDAYLERGKGERWGPMLGEDRYVVERDRDGALRVWRRPPTTVQDVVDRLGKSGMRLPTCDEWEHACGGGATTLFRWGDDCPTDFYPTDTCAEDRSRGLAWVLSLGKLAYTPAPATWDLHRRPNLFGLRIADDPYRWDLVSDGPLARGGDGGCNTCGGAGFFLGWLPLATAFRDPYGGPHRNVADDYHRVRRVIPLR